VSRKKLLLISSLIVVSTALFVIGVAVERSQGEAAEGTGTHQEVPGTPETGKVEESGEAKGGAENKGEVGHQDKGEVKGEVGHQEVPSSQADSEAGGQHGETILGINPEATGVVAAIVVGWLVLTAGLLFFGPRVLILVALAAVAAAAFDALEVVGQLGRNNSGVAALAAVVALLHAAIGILSLLIWREHRTDQRLARGD
jgi:hypothetical protein